MITYAIVFFTGVAVGFLLGNKRYRRIVGVLITKLGNWMQRTSELDHEDKGGWTIPVKGEHKDENVHEGEPTRTDQR
jgi:hypothetical protein